MVAAYVMITLLTAHVPYWVAGVGTLIILALFGVMFELSVYFPLRNRSFLPVIIATLGASVLLENGFLGIFGPYTETMPPISAVSSLNVGGIFISPQYLWIIGLAVVVLIGQYLFFERTMLGKKMEATAQDKEAARLLGIPVAFMIALTFALSAVIGGIAGLLVAPIYFVNTSMGTTMALKAFAASIIGGFGNPTGAIIGGLIIGIVEVFGSGYISSAYQNAYAFGVLVIFLLIRPQGIFGEKIAEKA